MVTVLEGYTRAVNTLKEAGIENAAAEADILFEEAVGKRRLALQPDFELTDDVAHNLQAFAQKRATHYPLQYICGTWPFLNTEIIVGEGVLIPRADTEIVAETAIELIAQKHEPQILDLCSGSGAIAMAIKTDVPDANITAVELSGDAYKYLLLNAKHYITTVQADVFTYQNEIADAGLHMIVANPPYIRTDEMPTLEADLAFEPRMALCSGDTGVEFYEHIASAYASKLRCGGYMVFEIGYQQAERVSAILRKNGF
ncbi:MAG: peptide chain release factor N(5)-glutamine methyltransferase, partial [Oscillospiraceae bacterium]|nr:peptide chain release factor N(5)-glutamine methyltransferase [Oscillospiraceae bacterium]